LWGATSVGYLLLPLKTHERVFTAVAALMLVTALPLTDQIGFAMALAFGIWHLRQKRRLAPA